MKSLFYIAFFVFNCFAAFTQVGEIQGKIKDMNNGGKGLPTAIVYIEVDSLTLTASIDEGGFYKVKPLPPGLYNLTVEQTGYTKTIVKSILVSADKTTFVDVELFLANDTMKIKEIKYQVPLVNGCDKGQGRSRPTPFVKLNPIFRLTN